MKIKRIPLIGFVILLAIMMTTLWLAALGSAQPVAASKPVELYKFIEKKFEKPAPVVPLLIDFPPSPEPWYAQDEIHVHPEPVIPGHPVEICVEVINTDPTAPGVAVLEFGVAPLGIGLLYEHIGAVELEVPSGGHAV